MADVNLNRLSVFVALVRAGSFTAAAEVLGMTKAMVSQHIARLENELGVTLLSRSTRRMALTEAGTAFHAACVRILAEAEAAIAQVGQGQQKPSGTLRLTATGDYGTAVVAPALDGAPRWSSRSMAQTWCWQGVVLSLWSQRPRRFGSWGDALSPCRLTSPARRRAGSWLTPHSGSLVALTSS